jgi:hypothetical protein
MPFRRVALLYATTAALRPPLTSRRSLTKRYESLYDVAVDATPAAALATWLEGWQCASDPQFPVETTIQDGALRLRYAAMPSHGVDVVARPPGADAPTTRITVERIGGPAPSTINGLLRSAEDRILDGLRHDLERDFGASLLRPPPTQPQPRQKQQMPDTLYDGSYGDAFEQEVIDLVEPSTEEDESIRSMFAEGEKLARRAAGLPEDDALDVVEATGEAQFEVRLDPGMKGGIDLFAPPPQIAGASAPVLDFSSVEVSPEVSARFGVLLRELRLSEDPQLILDAYRDVLLDDAFPLLARKAVADDVENSEAVEILNKEALKLATQLAEIAAAAEKQHLETIRLLCEAARDRGDAGLRQAAQTHRARLDDDFVAYIKHSVAVEASSLRQRGVSDPSREPSEWLAVLDAVRKATIAERGKDVRADVEIVESILALNNAEARSELLRLHVERLSRQPGRMRAFSSVVANICDNLLAEDAETRPPPELVEKLSDLRAGLMALAPAVADTAGGWMAEG